MRIDRDFIVLLSGRLLQILITLFSLRISTTIMPESELGLVYFIIALQNFFVLFLISPVGQYFNRQTSMWFFSGILKRCLFNHSVYIFLIATFSFVFLVISKLIGFLELSLYLISVTSFLVFIQSLNQTIIPMLNMIEKRYAFVFFNLFTTVFCTAFSFFLIVYWSSTALSWLLGIALGCGVSSIITYIWLRRYVELDSSPRENNIHNIKNIAKFALPIAFSTVLMWFINSGYRIFIEDSFGLEYLAILGVGLAVSSQIISAVESLVAQYLIPVLYRNITDANYNERTVFINQYISSAFPIYISLAIFLTFSIENIYPYLVSNKYHSFYMIAIYGVWIELFRVLTNVVSIVSQIEKKTSKTVLPYVVGTFFLALSLALNNYYDNYFDVMYFLIISSLIVFLVMAFRMYTLQNFSYPISKFLLVVFSVLPCALYFSCLSSSIDVSISGFFLLSIGVGIYLLGLMLYFGKFK
jgi:O-antigen/teichoic acid export membrane protein